MPKELEDKILIASGIDGSKIIEVESQLNALNTHILQRYGNGYKGIISKLNEKANDISYEVINELPSIEPHITSLLKGQPTQRKNQCVSLSALFVSLANKQELSSEIMTRPGHVWIRYDKKEYDPSSPLCPAGSDEQTTTLPGESIAGIMLEIRGRDELYKGNIADSIKVLTQAITFCPELPGPYSWRGYAFLQNKEFKKAREDMDKAVSKKPNFELPYTFRAELAITEKNPELALTMLKEAEKYSKNNYTKKLKSEAYKMEGKKLKAYFAMI